MRGKFGFTLIELLIVVAIIAILAAIAVPNFLEAQTRSRVARTQNDLRAIATAMESYYVDNGTYPASWKHKVLPTTSKMTQVDRRLLTTPISYISSVPEDIFRKIGGSDATGYIVNSMAYNENGPAGYDIFPKHAWMTHSWGPDGESQTGGYRTLPRIIENESLATPTDGNGLRYDPTNGTISDGDIHRFAGEAITRPS